MVINIADERIRARVTPAKSGYRLVVDCPLEYLPVIKSALSALLKPSHAPTDDKPAMDSERND